MYLIHYVGVSIPIYYILLINMVTPMPRCADAGAVQLLITGYIMVIHQ